ncbi:MAG: heme biosynthesis protein HemY [Bdellovibrionales bacterium]
MRYVIGFLLRITILVLLALWLMDAPGTARIVWHDFVIDTSVAVLIVFVGGLLYLTLCLHRLWRFLWDSPRFFKLQNKLKKSGLGQDEISKGLSSLAAHDPKTAQLHAKRARRYLGAQPQVLLLEAQTAQLAGEHDRAKTLFEAMAEQDETAILGYRGLIMAALRFQDYEEALSLAAKLEKKKGALPWIHHVRFQISAQQRNWPLALSSFEAARKGRFFYGEEGDQQESALLLARAREALRTSQPQQAFRLAKKAHELTPNWIPALLIFIETQIVTGRDRAARHLIQKIWRHMPHPEFLPLLYWAAKPDKPIKAIKLIQKLVRSKANDPVSLTAIAEAALKADLWGQARHALLTLEARGGATRYTYELLVRLERRQNKDEQAATEWLAKAAVAPLDPVWLCASCGQSHETWEAACPSCGAFNKIEWAVPGSGRKVPHAEETRCVNGPY